MGIGSVQSYSLASLPLSLFFFILSLMSVHVNLILSLTTMIVTTNSLKSLEHDD
jgi:hypothetical protein